jgi:hypothetical protein
MQQETCIWADPISRGPISVENSILVSKLGVALMFNFSANNLILVSSYKYDKYLIFIMKDIDTNRVYKLYDYSKACKIQLNKIYKVSGKVNSADRLYLILETYKEIVFTPKAGLSNCQSTMTSKLIES